jgi:quinol monooxygenase YgiN
MYGLIVKMTALPGRRDDALALLAGCSTGMPGCLSYVIAKDAADENALWVTEVWESEAAHDASLTLRAVQDAIPQIRPLIADFTKIAVTEPAAGTTLRS